MASDAPQVRNVRLKKSRGFFPPSRVTLRVPFPLLVRSHSISGFDDINLLRPLFLMLSLFLPFRFLGYMWMWCDVKCMDEGGIPNISFELKKELFCPREKWRREKKQREKGKILTSISGVYWKSDILKKKRKNSNRIEWMKEGKNEEGTWSVFRIFAFGSIFPFFHVRYMSVLQYYYLGKKRIKWKEGVREWVRVRKIHKNLTIVITADIKYLKSSLSANIGNFTLKFNQ